MWRSYQKLLNFCHYERNMHMRLLKCISLVPAGNALMDELSHLVIASGQGKQGCTNKLRLNWNWMAFSRNWMAFSRGLEGSECETAGSGLHRNLSLVCKIGLHWQTEISVYWSEQQRSKASYYCFQRNFFHLVQL